MDGEWREALRIVRERHEQQWAELSQAIQATLDQHAAGDLADARDSAELACDIEYDLTGDTVVTSPICDALGLQPDGE